MPKTSSTTLSEKDQQMIALFILKTREKNKGIASSMDWSPYFDTFKFTGDKAASNAFEYICLKLANIEKAMGASPSTPNGKGGSDTPAPATAKKATPARGQRKRQRPTKSADDDDLGLIEEEEPANDTPSKKRARISYANEEEGDYDEI